MRFHYRKPVILTTLAILPMSVKKGNLEQLLAKITDYWHPHIIGELNGQHLKAAKINGEFVFHHHEDEDEMFMVIRGHLKMELADQTIDVLPGEFIIIPKGVGHKPVAVTETEILLFEPAGTLNTGNITNEFTKKNLGKL